MQYDDVITNPRWRTENRFWLHLGAILADLPEIWNGDEESDANIRYVTKNCNFRKFKMADCRHFENSIISISQLRIIRFRSN